MTRMQRRRRSQEIRGILQAGCFGDKTWSKVELPARQEVWTRRRRRCVDVVKEDIGMVGVREEHAEDGVGFETDDRLQRRRDPDLE